MNLWLQKVDAKLNNLTPVYTIRADGYAAQIAAFGGGVKSLTFRGAPLVETYDGFPPLAAGVVLAPWPNRIADGTYTWRGERHQLPITEPERNNAIHGFVADRVWECVSHSVGSVTLAVNIAPQAGYPWFVRLVARPTPSAGTPTSPPAERPPIRAGSRSTRPPTSSSMVPATSRRGWSAQRSLRTRPWQASS